MTGQANVTVRILAFLSGQHWRTDSWAETMLNQAFETVDTIKPESNVIARERLRDVFSHFLAAQEGITWMCQLPLYFGRMRALSGVFEYAHVLTGFSYWVFIILYPHVNNRVCAVSFYHFFSWKDCERFAGRTAFSFPFSLAKLRYDWRFFFSVAKKPHVMRQHSARLMECFRAAEQS